MTNATATVAHTADPRAPIAADSSIVSGEAAHFGALAGDWWDPKGTSAMLHRLNPVRLKYIRDAVDRHWNSDTTARRPLAGKRALDMGCGAGLLAEPLARLGADVTGVDAAPENIAAAQAHAALSGLTIDYRAGGTDAIAGMNFDLITCMEVVEHVSDPEAFVASLANTMAPGGLLIMSTPNRTPMSKLAMITVAEGLGQIPKGTHDWDKFLTPEELRALFDKAGLETLDIRGLSYRPGTGFEISNDLKLDYLVSAIRA